MAEINLAAQLSWSTSNRRQTGPGRKAQPGDLYRGACALCGGKFEIYPGRLQRRPEMYERLRRLRTREAPFYERELAEALRARILSERGQAQKALILLRTLENEVSKKHWPYQLCILKLHMCEVLIKQRKLEMAERYARKALKLATAMQAAPLSCHANLLLGLVCSPLRNPNNPSNRQRCEVSSEKALLQGENATEQLQQACQ